MEIKIKEGTNIEITGVKKIVELTPTSCILELESSPLKIEGNNLALTKTNNDINTVILEGDIYSLFLKKEPKKESFIKKLFA